MSATPAPQGRGAARELRDYQQQAVDAAVKGLRDRDAGQLHMACGTGKTLVALRIAEHVAAGDALIVVAVPTVALVDQVLRDWRADSSEVFSALAVCHDDTLIDAPVHLDDLTSGVTTDPAEIAAWIRQTPGRRVIASTYVSVHALAEALRAVDVTADLLVCDEAHHLMGRQERVTRRVLDRTWLPARRRLFATATPRANLGIEDRTAGPVYSCEDEHIFGPVLASYPFSDAIRDGWLKDYRVAVIGVREADALKMLADDLHRYEVPEAAVGVDLRMLATQAALLQAHQHYGARRVITFHHRIDDADHFARTLRATARRIGPPGASEALTCGHVSGRMDTEQRRIVLGHLRQPPGGGWAVVSNARCLGECVDIPAVDAVVFAHPKKSAVDIIQAVGRAIRRTQATSDTATLVLPIVIDDQPGAAGDLDPADYRVLWRVIRALRAHDEDLGIELDHTRTDQAAGTPEAQLPGKISITLPPGTADRVLEQLTLMLVQQTTSPWWEGYAAARAYHRDRGHLLVPQSYRTPAGYRLGSWINTQRRRRAALSAEQISRLDDIGMVWDAISARWDAMYALAVRWRSEHGHARIPKDAYLDGQPVGVWLARQRYRLAKAALPEQRASRIRALDVGVDRFAEGLAACDRYIAAHGNLDVPRHYVDDTGYRLGSWINTQRSRASGAKTALNAQRRAELDRRGMIWRKAPTKRQPTSAEVAELLAAQQHGPRSAELRELIARLSADEVEHSAIAGVLGISRSAISSRLKTHRQTR